MLTSGQGKQARSGQDAGRRAGSQPKGAQGTDLKSCCCRCCCPPGSTPNDTSSVAWLEALAGTRRRLARGGRAVADSGSPPPPDPASRQGPSQDIDVCNNMRAIEERLQSACAGWWRRDEPRPVQLPTATLVESNKGGDFVSMPAAGLPAADQLSPHPPPPSWRGLPAHGWHNMLPRLPAMAGDAGAMVK